MATTIKTKNSATPGSAPSSLEQGEMALNVTDGKLFYGSGSGNVVKEFAITANADTGSLLVTASYAADTITFEKGDGSTFDLNIS